MRICATSPDRVMQSLIVAAWEASSLSKAQVSRAVPTISRAVLYRYLDGERTVYMRERSAEAVLSLLESGPRGPKQGMRTKAAQRSKR